MERRTISSFRRVLEDVISFWKEVALKAHVIKRDYKLPLKPRDIVVISGARRVGKTYLLFQHIKELIEAGVDENEIYYINFEDERIPQRAESLTELIPAILSISGKEQLYLLLDEIHVIPGWEQWLNRQLMRGHKLYVTGSTMRLQPDKISSILRGRTITYTIYPLSFKEYLRFRGAKNLDLPVEEKRSLLQRYFSEYLWYGGFPEIALLQDPGFKIAKLQEYFRAILYRDVIEANRIRNLDLMERMIKILLDSTYFGSTKMYNTLRSQGIKTSKTTIMNYKRAIEMSYMIMQIEIFSHKIKDKLQYPKKIYCIDHGLRRAISLAYSKSESKSLENAVYIELLRSINPVTHRVNYYKTINRYEVDFVITRNMKPTSLIQVAYRVNDDVIKREERALIRAMRDMGLKRGYLITDTNYREKKEINGKVIEYIPVLEFFMKSHEYTENQ